MNSRSSTSARIAAGATYIDWRALVDLLKKYRLNAVAVRGATAEMIDAIKARGLALDDGAGGDRAREDVAAASAAVTIAPVQAARPRRPPSRCRRRRRKRWRCRR